MVRYVTGGGIVRTRSVSSYFRIVTSYTLTNLRFGEVYNITIRPEVRFPGCFYPTLDGEYSDSISAVTLETGNNCV